VDGLVTAFGLVVRDLSADVCVAATQFLTAVLRRPLEPGLTTAIGVMDEAGCWLSAGQRHLQRVGGQLRAQMIGERPADHAPAECIQDDG
jgi:hypothetical protein